MEDNKVRKLEKKDMKIIDLENILKKKQRRVKKLSNQLDDIKYNDPNKLDALEKVLMNSVNLEEKNNLRYLIKSGEIEQVLDDNDKLITIMRIFTAMLEGAIPIYNPKNIVFSKNRRQFMKNLEKDGIDNAKDYILQNIEEFHKIFEALDMSFKLINKTLNNYGRKYDNNDPVLANDTDGDDNDADDADDEDDDL